MALNNGQEIRFNRDLKPLLETHMEERDILTVKNYIAQEIQIDMEMRSKNAKYLKEIRSSLVFLTSVANPERYDALQMKKFLPRFLDVIKAYIAGDEIKPEQVELMVDPDKKRTKNDLLAAVGINEAVKAFDK